MAGKRHLESLDPVIFNKLPRLEPEPGLGLPASLCKASPLPPPGPESHCSYKGSYFACPLPSHDGPEPLARWSPAAAYLHYAGSAVGQPLRAEGTLVNCLLYRREAESLGARLQPPSAEKGKDSLVRELLMAREKWASQLGAPDPLAPAPGLPFPLKKPVAVHKAVAPAGCATLAVPKPVYRAPVCFVEPRAPPALATRADGLHKRPGEADWALPAAAAASHPPRRAERPERGPPAEPGLLPLHPGLALPAKDPPGSAAGFSPYYAAFEKYGPPAGAPFLEASYPAACHPGKGPEVGGGSGGGLRQDAWSQLRAPAASPLPRSPAPAYRERPPACYPHAPYPLPLHRPALLYHPEAPALEKPASALSSVPGSYKAFGFPASGDPQPFPSTYLTPQVPRSYFAGPLESYAPRAAGSGAVASPPSKAAALPREAEPPRRPPACKVDFPQPSPSFAFGPPDVAFYSASFAGTEPPREGHGDSRAAAPHGARAPPESSRRKAVASQNSAFQPVCALDKLPQGSERLLETFPKGELGYSLDFCPAAKPAAQEQDPPYLEKRRASLALRESTHGARGAPEAPPAAPIVIADSPVPHQHLGKGEAPKVKGVAKELVPSSQVASPDSRLKDLQSGEVSPSSPPMPVINNVFSLAPYRDYLEGSEGSAEVPFSKDHPKVDTPLRNAANSLGSKDSFRSPSEPAAVEDISEMSSVLPAGKEASQALQAGNSVVRSCKSMAGEGGSCHKQAPESHKPRLLPCDWLAKSNPGPQGGSLSGPGGAGGRGPAPDGVVLDLSLKKRLMKPGETQGPAGHVKGTSEGEDAAGEKEEPPRKVETGEGAKAQTLPLLIEVGSGDKSNFQSSATFMFKKYKILKSLLPGAVPPGQAARPQAMQPSPPAVAPSGSVPAPQSPHASPQPHSPPVPPALHADPQPSTSVLQVTCLNLKLPDISKPLLPSAPEAPRTLGEDNVSLPSHCESPAQQTSASQYFTALHASLCNVISCSVSGSSPELLQEWLKRAEPEEELKEMPKSPPKPKNGSRLSEPQKPTKGKEIWLAFKDVAALLSKLLSQLETFMFTRKCPFPHVVRAGAIFIPIHVVKEKLFPKLPGASVDQVLQEHKVELRPTTLSEEKLLRDLELKSCTSRMLKLLALKQLPDIYPDLLNLHWHDSVKQQLGSSSQAGQHASK
ncbi:uncharacterized protein C15orf39 homolog [Apteryx mantelli]|uniref:Uncharacterized protein C15orf39 homolog n=1 Tax=Apteryx mantelli TaxID=2696672 RepID=A0ABM4F9T7_9AVES